MVKQTASPSQRIRITRQTFLTLSGQAGVLSASLFRVILSSPHPPGNRAGQKYQEREQGKMKHKVSSKKESAENEKVINWCAIRASCNSFEMSFPLFFYLVIMLARGDKKLGFCHCPACNLGYREMLASIANGKENKKLTAQSREIVIKARGDKIDGLTFDISEFF